MKKSGKNETELLGISSALRRLIVHFHERRLRVAPPAGSYAAKDIEDIEFYMKRLIRVEENVHLEHAPPKVETEFDSSLDFTG